MAEDCIPSPGLPDTVRVKVARPDRPLHPHTWGQVNTWVRLCMRYSAPGALLLSDETTEDGSLVCTMVIEPSAFDSDTLWRYLTSPSTLRGLSISVTVNGVEP